MLTNVTNGEESVENMKKDDEREMYMKKWVPLKLHRRKFIKKIANIKKIISRKVNSQHKKNHIKESEYTSSN